MGLNLNQAFLHEALLYAPVEGSFTWKVRPQEHFKTRRGWNVFNGAYAGKPAGHLSAEGYLVIGLQKKAFKAHRLAWFMSHGGLPADRQIDHKNRQRSDNRLKNLRLVGALENAQNASIRSDNTSGLPGVCLHKQTGKWLAQISVNNRQTHIGLFASPQQAAAAREQAVREHHSRPESS